MFPIMGIMGTHLFFCNNGDAFIFQSIIEGAALTAALVGVSKLVVRRTGKPEVSGNNGDAFIFFSPLPKEQR
jgi:hypothetical protein